MEPEKSPVLVDRNKAGRPAYILWLIREGYAGSWKQLCELFNVDPLRIFGTITIRLSHSISELKDAGLIRTNKVDGTFNITKTLPKVQNVLRISLEEIAHHEAGNSIRVTPTFNLPREKSYSYDLFVLMPFSPHLQPVYDDHIEIVARRLNKSIARADDFFSTQSIIEEIVAAILHSKVLIADCTGRNANVFYEIGIAHTFGKPVILITQNSDDVPFDLKHRRYIHYEYTPRGMAKFEKQLQATLSNIKQLYAD